MFDIKTDNAGQDIYKLIEKLFPICRSITGNGVRETLAQVKQHIAVDIKEVPSGTKVFDWTVPREWNVDDAYIKDSAGNRIVDFRDNNLHLVSYSVPVNKKMNLEELKEHLHTDPDHPEWIPYRTSYYNETWGFCLSQNQFQQLSDDEYEVRVDSRLENGSLTYGEYFLPGTTDEEILFFTHLCHPSLCNDNLSGVALTTFLAKLVESQETRYSYRFVFAPATIGSITWLSQNEKKLGKIKHGLVVAVVGDSGPMTYKRTRAGNAEIDRAVIQVLRDSGDEHEILEFSPYGYDERQFCSPGVNLSVGRLTRTPNGCYPEYHTSADNLDLVKAEALRDSLEKYLKVLEVLESNRTYINMSPKGEPQLGKRGLYRTTGGHQDIATRNLAMLWILNQSDGNHSLLDISEKSGLPYRTLIHAIKDLSECGLIEENSLHQR